MSEAFGAPKLERVTSESPLAEAEAAGAIKKLAILPTPTHPAREARPITNLGKVFGQFAELQQQIAEQVVTLEDSVHHQKQDLAAAMAQLPELRERINWLIASFYEQSKKDESVRDRLSRHDASLESLTETVRILAEQQNRWQIAFDEVIGSLVRAKAAMNRE
jgi:uncharacterized coiled-coil DUF342 family protein